MNLACTSTTQRQELRKQLRARRCQLTAKQQALASYQLTQRLMHLPAFIQAQHLAVYLAQDGELDTRTLVDAALALNKKVYLPVLHPRIPRLLWWVRWQPGKTPMQTNRFGILEPCLQGYGAHKHQRRPSWALDLVCLPLVGFDAQGQRLGMGGGFYDRSFSINYPRPRRPYLLGLAHECQQVDQLPQAAWDVPLNAIQTPQQLFCSKAGLDQAGYHYA